MFGLTRSSHEEHRAPGLCKKAGGFVIFEDAGLYVMESDGYEHQSHGFRVFRQIHSQSSIFWNA
jgi:hypothetical protein